MEEVLGIVFPSIVKVETATIASEHLDTNLLWTLIVRIWSLVGSMVSSCRTSPTAR